MLPLREHIEKFWGHFRNNEIYVACSGGLDSICLLHVLHETGLNPRAIHVNYNLRGEESNADETFVKAFCNDRKIPCETRVVKLADQIEEGGNLQALAREFRYNWFKEIIADGGYVFLAHHADDQVETFFLNLARNSGVMGLACMKSEHQGICRPLLEYSKEDLIDYAHINQLEWREDTSNSSNKYRRNLLRNKLLPSLQNDIPELKKSVLEMILQFQAYQLELEVKIRPLIKHICTTNALDINTISELNEFEQIELLRQLHQPASLRAELLKLLKAQKGKKVEFTNDNSCLFSSVVKEQNALSFIPRNSTAPAIQLETNLIGDLPQTFTKDVIYLNPEKVTGTLKLRKWQEGDRMQPVGMDGQKLISDIIAEAHVRADHKENVLVLHDDDHIHWCVGYKIGAKAIADNSINKILECKIISGESQV